MLALSAPYFLAFACVSCRRSFKRRLAAAAVFKRVCPACGATAVQVGRHFKPPSRTNRRQWEKVAFLIANGFPFHRVYESRRGGSVVPYPRTLKAAHDFVKKYSDQAWRGVGGAAEQRGAPAKGRR